MRHFHEPAGSNETNDPAGWDRASYTPDLFAELGEPLPDAVNGYRAAALAFMHVMATIDEFILAARPVPFDPGRYIQIYRSRHQGRYTLRC
jgi:hypothetical protein